MKILKSAASLITYFFTIGGSFLLNIAPPKSLITGTNILSLTGLVTIISLAVLLIIKAIIKLSSKQKAKKHHVMWFIIGVFTFSVFCVSATKYFIALDSKTFSYFDDIKVIKGDTLQANALSAKNESELKNGIDLSDADLLAKFGGINNITFVWKKDSVKENEHLLNLLYVLTVISIAISTFSLIEGVLEKGR